MCSATPDGPVVQGRGGLEVEFGKRAGEGFFDAVAQRQAETFELCDINIARAENVGLAHANAEFAFVMAEGPGSDQCATQPEGARAGHGRKQGASRSIKGLEAFGAEQPDQALAVWALQFTPRVAIAEEAVLLEVAASLRLFGGRAALRGWPVASRM